MSALLVVILVAAGEANHPATLGAAGAARELLGAELDVEVREMEACRTTSGRFRSAPRCTPRAWSSSAGILPSTGKRGFAFTSSRARASSDRVILFDDRDDVAERGRTVGYAIASMITAPPPDRSTAAGARATRGQSDPGRARRPRRARVENANARRHRRRRSGRHGGRRAGRRVGRLAQRTLVLRAPLGRATRRFGPRRAGDDRPIDFAPRCTPPRGSPGCPFRRRARPPSSSARGSTPCSCASN